MNDPTVRDVINETARILNEAVSASVPHEVPQTLRTALTENAFIFSGFKTYHSLREVGLSLLDENGNVKTLEAFTKDVQAINDRYNVNYLRAEYQHAVGSSLMAVKWQQLAQNTDRYNLLYRTAEDNKVRDEHRALDGITLPADDPFWDSYYPPNGWGCRCQAVQVRKNKYPQSDPAAAMRRGNEATDDLKQKMFRFNAGKEMVLFPPKHPYYKAPKAAAETIKDVAGVQYMRQRRKEIEKQAREHKNEPLHNSGFNRAVTMSTKTINEFLNQNHDFIKEKNELLLNIKNVFAAAKYIGYNPNYIKKDVKFSHIFEIELCGSPSWLIVREYTNGLTLLYSISCSPKIATGLVKD